MVCFFAELAGGFECGCHQITRWLPSLKVRRVCGLVVGVYWGDVKVGDVGREGVRVWKGFYGVDGIGSSQVWL